MKSQSKKITLGISIILVLLVGYLYVQKESAPSAYSHGQIVGNQSINEIMIINDINDALYELELANTVWYKNDDLGISFIIPPGYEQDEIAHNIDDAMSTPKGEIKHISIDVGKEGILIRDLFEENKLVNLKVEQLDYSKTRPTLNDYSDNDFEVHITKNIHTNEVEWIYANKTNPKEHFASIRYASRYSVDVVSDSLDSIEFIALVQSIKVH